MSHYEPAPHVSKRERIAELEADKSTAVLLAKNLAHKLKQAEAEVAQLTKRLAVLDDLGYDPALDSITIHRDGTARAEEGGE